MADATVKDTTAPEFSEEELAQLELEHLSSGYKEPYIEAETEDNPDGIPSEAHTHSRTQYHVTHTHPIFEDSIHA